MSGSDRIWITWERQRRSVELAGILGCKLYIFDFKGRLRYPKCIYNTLKILIYSPGRTVFVQNPSMVLATMACFFKFVSSKKVIVDRHTTFPLKKKKITPYRAGFILMSKFTLKTADLTIVTNEYLAGLVRKSNGLPFVLPDKLPDLVKTQQVRLGEGYNVFMISSFGKDEPVAEAINAAGRLKKQGVRLYISGNKDKLDAATKDNAPDNVVFTGFIDEQDFVNHVCSADAVMALTTADHCMLCGCYEAVAAEKPLITSNKEVLRQYFNGSVFVDNTVEGISRGIVELKENYEAYVDNATILKKQINREWSEMFNNFKHRIDRMSSNNSP